MKRETVNSSTIKEVGYDEATSTLEILFTSGGVYQYADVPKETFETFMRTESRGHFFQACIRPCYACVRLHVKDCYQGSLYRQTLGDKCPDTCECWCHKQRKDVSDAKASKETDASTKKKAVKTKRTPI